MRVVSQKAVVLHMRVTSEPIKVQTKCYTSLLFPLFSLFLTTPISSSLATLIILTVPDFFLFIYCSFFFPTAHLYNGKLLWGGYGNRARKDNCNYMILVIVIVLAGSAGGAHKKKALDRSQGHRMKH